MAQLFLTTDAGNAPVRVMTTAGQAVELIPQVAAPSALVTDYFDASEDQTLFNLSLPPSSPSTVLMFVNGVQYRNGVDYAVVLQQATWLDVDFQLGAFDAVMFLYD